MSEYIVELDGKHSIALKLALAEEMRGGDFLRGEIVRCRDCKHYDDFLNSCEWWGAYQQLADPDGFCFWGERRTND